MGVTGAGTITLFTRAAEHLLGYQANEVHGRPIASLLPDLDWAAVWTQARLSPDGNTILERPSRSARYADGSVRLVDLRMRPFENDGQPQCFITLRQATARPSEAPTTGVSTFYRALRAIHDAIAQEGNLSSLLDTTCRIAVDIHGVAMAWIGIVSDGSDELRPCALYGTHPDYVTDIRVSSRADTPEGQGPGGIAFREARRVLVNDLADNDLTRPWHATARRHGFSSVGSFPILRGGQPFGVLSLYHTERNAFDEEMASVVENMTHTLSLALDAKDREHRRASALQALTESERRFRAYFDQALIGMAAKSPTKGWLDVNEALCSLLGYSRDEFLKLTWPDLTYPGDLDKSLFFWEQLHSGAQDTATFAKAYLHKDGRPVHTYVTAQAVRDHDGQLEYVVVLVEDATSEKRQEDMLARVGRILDESSDEIYMFDADTNRFIFVNSRACANLGYSMEELQTLTPLDIKVRLSRERFAQMLAPLRAGSIQFVEIESEHQRKDGSLYPFEGRLHLSQQSGAPVFVAILQDVTQRKQLELTIQHQATHDALTGLPNRIFFHEILERAIASTRRNDTLAAVLFLDLDGFQDINNSLGHEYGDALLQELAARLTASVRKEDWVARNEDVVARQEGDQFAILLQNLLSVHAITTIAERILAEVAKPFAIKETTSHITASLGITAFPFDNADSQGLLRNAHVAMGKAKKAGKNTYAFYAASMSAQMQERRLVEDGLRRALHQGEFILHYQPKVSLATGRLAGVEALIRWQHPERGLIPPGLFIPIAEETGLIVPLGEWVLRTACEQSRAWKNQGLPPIRIAVNLSSRQFSDQDLPMRVEQILRETGLSATPEQIELEVTESMLMDDIEKTGITLKAFHDMGLRLAIDDFGTGYSSLSYLQRFCLNTLKIDQSFMRGVTTNGNDASIARAIITLGHSLGLSVIAEGVETAEQVAFLREAQCDEMQGYYYSRPLPADALKEWLKINPLLP